MILASDPALLPRAAPTWLLRAYAWAKIYGPALFDLPRSGAMLDAFADAVMRIERARPGSIARALDGVRAAQGTTARATAGDDLLTPVRFTKDFDYACRVLRLNPHAASDALHAVKGKLDLRGDENCTFNLTNGDILFNGEVIGNLGD